MIIFKEGTVDHHQYIREGIPVALKYGNQTLGSHWTFEQIVPDLIFIIGRNNGVKRISHLSSARINGLQVVRI